MNTPKISAIIPTIGRLSSLQELFDSLIAQTHSLHEVIVADGSSTSDIKDFVAEFGKQHPKIKVHCLSIQPPNAVRQRQAAIEISKGELLLLLDDDVVLEPRCLERMLEAINSQPAVVGVCAMLEGGWFNPTKLWSLYLKYVLNLESDEWQGRVVGPLLRFGYNPAPETNKEMDWLGTGNSLIKRASFEAIGGFSEFFLNRATINEDVDLGLKLRSQGKILLCHNAYMVHNQAPGGRLTRTLIAEDDLYNRFRILTKTLKYSIPKALRLIFIFVFIETLSGLFFALTKFKVGDFIYRLFGHLRAVTRIAWVVFEP